MNKETIEVHPIVQALRDALREMAKKLTPDVLPAAIYTPREPEKQ